MRLLDGFVRREAAQCVKHGIRMSVIGRRDRLPPLLVEGIERIESETAGGRMLHVRLAIDYSARDAIWYAAECAIRTGVSSREHFAWAVRSGRGTPAHVPDVDLLIRTGGERRLSDFLLWELAYAELYFIDTMWPDFRREDLEAALAWFETRQRRFGRVREAVPLESASAPVAAGRDGDPSRSEAIETPPPRSSNRPGVGRVRSNARTAGTPHPREACRRMGS
jgi:undecaprenyl diphosphate synthase